MLPATIPDEPVQQVTLLCSKAARREGNYKKHCVQTMLETSVNVSLSAVVLKWWTTICESLKSHLNTVQTPAKQAHTQHMVQAGISWFLLSGKVVLQLEILHTISALLINGWPYPTSVQDAHRNVVPSLFIRTPDILIKLPKKSI